MTAVADAWLRAPVEAPGRGPQQWRPGAGVPAGLYGGCYAGRRVLVTGHTGFKGSWLVLWLQAMGAQVHGLALDPADGPSHWAMLGLDLPEWRQDIRDAAAVRTAVAAARPEVVFHLAAQPLVRRSYDDPLETWSTNVMGTAHVLDACRHTPGVQAVLVVTTDKCYENQEWAWGYRERDALGGHDPYSASKAAAELAVASWRKAFGAVPGAPLLATARAGNVIGGGDWSVDRLVPDLVRALGSGLPLVVRSPQATRPWQHVLESLSGYLLLGQQLLAGRADLAQAFNFGPGSEGNRSVADVLHGLRACWPSLAWAADCRAGPHEATLLQLDSSLARSRLGWQPVWGFDETLRRTADWYRVHQAGGVVPSAAQLAAYVAAAQQAGLAWAATAGSATA
jgi:CDP-glucose 4,6-dehydratase